MIRAAILGGSGYAGGELLRLLLDHHEVEVTQITSERSSGHFVHFTHPNLRGHTELQFTSANDLEHCDLLFSALPHGQSMKRINELADVSERIIDLSADFRLDDAASYQHWYGGEHQAPQHLERFVYGLPETRRDQLVGATSVSGVGCNATAILLGLLPLADAELIDWSRGIVVEVKVGSSESGHRSSDASHHPERSGAVRSFAPIGHRHASEVLQELGRKGVVTELHLSLTAVEMVRGALATCHLFTRPGVEERSLFRCYRQFCNREPFVRLVKERRGLYRAPEPKILAGSNHAEVGFYLDPDTGRVVVLCAIDNLVKGSAGSAVQAMNLMMGWDETLGLGFPGLHPV